MSVSDEVMDITPRKRGVKFNDEIIPVRKLNIKEVKSIEKQLKAAGKNTDKVLEVQDKMLINCGVEQKIIDELDIDGYYALIEFVMGSKKN